MREWKQGSKKLSRCDASLKLSHFLYRSTEYVHMNIHNKQYDMSFPQTKINSKTWEAFQIFVFLVLNTQQDWKLFTVLQNNDEFLLMLLLSKTKLIDFSTFKQIAYSQNNAVLARLKPIHEVVWISVIFFTKKDKNLGKLKCFAMTLNETFQTLIST